MKESKTVIRTVREEETVLLGRMVGIRLRKGDVIGLTGELGTGKTYFVKGLAEGLEIPDDQYVASPTFTLMNEYLGKFHLYHFDLYRIQSGKELEDIGFDDYMYENGVVVIEWAEKMAELLPSEHLFIEMLRVNENQRELIFTGRGDRYNQLIKEIEEDQKYYFQFSKFLGG